jgi:acetyl-CoA acetyltransferase
VTEKTLRNSVAFVGVGESEIGIVPNMTGLGLNAQAAKRALAETGLRPSDIDGVLTAYSLTEPYFMLGSVLCEYLGLKPSFCASMVVGGGTPAVMLKHAAQAVVSGQAHTILVCAGENRATGQTRDQAVAALSAVGHPYFEQPYGASIPGLYSMIARRHMHEFGTTRQQLSQVAVTTREHALLHPNSHMKTPLTVEDVQQAKPIAEPFTLLDCCLISDGAAAMIVTSPERAADLKSRPIYLLGAGEYHTHEHLICAESLTRFGAVESGRRAYAMAGLGPEDMDFAELYDCFTIVPLIEMEEFGFCGRGESGPFYEDGNARIGGKLPINTHGGLLSHAQAGASGGMFGIVEAVRQLRGGLGKRQVDNAEVGLVHNEGGILSSHCTLILGTEKR